LASPAQLTFQADKAWQIPTPTMLEVKLDALPEVSSEAVGSAGAKPGRPVLSK